MSQVASGLTETRIREIVRDEFSRGDIAKLYSELAQIRAMVEQLLIQMNTQAVPPPQKPDPRESFKVL